MIHFELRLWIVVMIVIFGVQYLGKSFDKDTRRSAAPRQHEMAAKPNPRRPAANRFILPPSEVQDAPGDEKGISAGTAFAMQSDGRWLTAQHVVEDCRNVIIGSSVKRRTGLQYRRKDGTIVNGSDADVYAVASNADMAMLASRFGVDAYFAPADPADYTDNHGQRGFAIGFPQGAPGEVSATLLGLSHTRMHRGKEKFDQPLLTWAIDRRYPEDLTLGGISGGPILNEKGEVIGVNTAGSDRRGRLMTSSPDTLSEMTRLTGANPRLQPITLESPLTDTNLPDQAGELRSQSHIVQVLCRH